MNASIAQATAPNTSASQNSKRIVLVGGPGGGKSTLAQALNVALKMEGRDSEFASEFARQYLRRTGALQTVFEQFIIFAGACQREDELKIHDFVVCDSSAFLSEVYYQYERSLRGEAGTDDVKLEHGLNELRRMCRNRLLKTDYIFFVPTGLFGPGKDPTRRYLDTRDVLSDRIRSYLDNNDVEYHTVESTDLEERVEEVMDVLRSSGAFDEPDPDPVSG